MSNSSTCQASDLHDGVVDPVPQIDDVILILKRTAETESIGQSRVTTRARGKSVDLFVRVTNARRALRISPIDR